MAERVPVYILVGSNIEPVHYLHEAIRLLRERFEIYRISPAWETPAVGSPGPNFLNLVLELGTDLDPEALKMGVLRPVEAGLGRVRTDDKFAPRKIDLDILIWNDRILEPNLWTRAHIACPLASLLPDLTQPDTGKRLAEIAILLQRKVSAKKRDDLSFA